VGLHGGTIVAHSEGAGHGSEFEVRLPLATSTADPSMEPKPVRRPGTLHMLVIEDMPDVLDMLKTLLELDGHQVDTALDGQQGLDMIARRRPDVALVDIGLPVLDGYEFARQVRSAPANADMLLVALTGYGQADDQRRALESGFDAHLVKPVDMDKLADLLAQLTACS
jgi:CheY-like chemotaxis protein